jgi:hypothetical protein
MHGTGATHRCSDDLLLLLLLLPQHSTTLAAAVCDHTPQHKPARCQLRKQHPLLSVVVQITQTHKDRVRKLPLCCTWDAPQQQANTGCNRRQAM